MDARRARLSDTEGVDVAAEADVAWILALFKQAVATHAPPPGVLPAPPPQGAALARRRHFH